MICIVSSAQASIVDDFKLGSNISSIPNDYIAVDENGKPTGKALSKNGIAESFMFFPKGDVGSKNPSTIMLYTIRGKISLTNITLNKPSEFEATQSSIKSIAGKPIATSAGIKNSEDFKKSVFSCGIEGKQDCPQNYFEIYHTDDIDYLLIDVRVNQTLHQSASIMLFGETTEGSDYIKRMSMK